MSGSDYNFLESIISKMKEVDIKQKEKQKK